MLVVGDVLPPEASALSDAWALLRFGWEDGFFCAAVLGLVRTFFSDYRQLRAKVGLTRYSEQEMAGKLAAAGFCYLLDCSPQNERSLYPCWFCFCSWPRVLFLQFEVALHLSQLVFDIC